MTNRKTDAARGTPESGARMSPRTAAVVLVVAVVAIGAVGYFVLSAISSVHTSTRNSCESPSTPECAGPTHSSSPNTVIALVAAAPARA